MKAHAPVPKSGTLGENPTLAQSQRQRPVPSVGLIPAPTRQAEPEITTAQPPRPDALLVDQAAGSHQLSKSEFLQRLREPLHEAVNAELVGTGWTADQCPYIECWFAYYERRDAAQIETALRRYVPQAGAAATAEEYLPLLVERIRSAAARWRASGEIDAPAAQMPEAVATQAALGPGKELASTVRSQMEMALGTSLEGTRVHDDATAARLSARHGAQAFAVGAHIAFGTRAYQPDTDMGRALLAHELAHTVQQRGATSAAEGSEAVIERSADRHAISAFSRLKAGLEHLLRPPVIHTGLRLSRCKANIDEVTAPPLQPDVAPKPGDLPAIHDADVDVTKLAPTLETQGWKRPSKDSLLFVIGTQAGATQPQLFIVPANKYVLEAPAASTPAPPATTVAAYPAVAHASLQILNAGNGVGLPVDVGGVRTAKGPTDAPAAVITEVRALTADLNLQTYQAANLSHMHGDHLSWLLDMMKDLKIDPAQVYVQPGIEKIVEGSVGQTFAEFKKTTGLLPQPLKATTVAGPTNEQVTHTTLRVGKVVIEMAVGTSELADYLRAASSGDPAAASKLADAATPLQHIRWDDNNVEIVVVGDLRGRDIENLAAKMGDDAFKKLVGNARVIVGLHHLGAINEAADVRGLQKLVGAMGGGAEAITVVAQVGPDKELNTRLIEALQEMGIRVVAVGEPDAAQRKNIQIKDTGDVEQTGGKTWEARTEVRAAQNRLQQLEHAIATLERLDDYRSVDGKTRAQVLGELREAAQQVRDRLTQRASIATRNLHVKSDAKGAADKLAADKVDLAANLTTLDQTSSIERELGDQHLAALARSNAELEQLQKEREAARTSGEASDQLRKLYASVDPVRAKEIWLEETTGAPAYRGEIRDTWGRIEARLETEVRQQEMMQPINFGAKAKGAAWVGLALQALELASPGIEQWAKSKDDQKRNDFEMFFRDLIWWQEKGMRPAVRGMTAKGEITDGDALVNSIERRLFDDKPKSDRKLPKELENVDPIQMLWIPSLDQWDPSVRAAFLDSLRTWLSAQIKTDEDYFEEMRTGIKAPIRTAADDAPISDTSWQFHFGKVVDGHVHQGWQDSPELSTMMNAARATAEKGTNDAIAKWIARSSGAQLPNSNQGPSASSPSTGRALPSEKVVLKTKTKKDATPYSLIRGKAPMEINHAVLGPALSLLVLDRDAPQGYVWVAPGDSDAYMRMRDFVGWVFVDQVKIPNQPRGVTYVNDPNYDATPPKPREYMNAEQFAAWSQRNEEGFSYDDRADNMYQGTVYIYERRKLPRGIVLVRTRDLAPP